MSDDETSLTAAQPQPREESKIILALSTVARLLLAGTWLYAGGIKISDLGSSIRSVNAYELLPTSLAQIVGAALPMVEILLGLLLLAGLLTRPAAILSSIFLVLFIAGIISAWARGLDIDCGCFGNGGVLAAGEKPTYFQDILRDLGLLAAAVLLTIRPRTWFSLDRLLMETDKGQTQT
ncbi:MAG: DoxX family membrane protein [Longispora sp.]|nr:DoxX family membrane protein [Longispora sp. (in: high G+C Gram-positive bacteria)]